LSASKELLDRINRIFRIKIKRSAVRYFRVKASKGEVVVFYFEPLATQDLKFSGVPEG